MVVGALRGALVGIVLAVGIMSLTYDRPNGEVYSAFETSYVGPVAVRNDFLAPFADKLDEEVAEQTDQPPTGDRRWDVPR